MKAKLLFLDVMTIDSLPKDLPKLNPSHIWIHEDIKNLLIFIRKMLHHPIFGQLLLGPENYNSCLEVLFCCCRTFLVGLHDIGKLNDIDIGLQYCDIDITHDIYVFCGNAECLLNALNINIHVVILRIKNKTKKIFRNFVF